MIPELIEGMDFLKGPYYAENGDFSSVGSARIRYFDVLPQNIGVFTVGTDNYLRAMGAVQPEVAGGHLLIAAEAVGYDGPWVVPEDLRKFNGVLRYTRGDTTGGFHVGADGLQREVEFDRSNSPGRGRERHSSTASGRSMRPTAEKASATASPSAATRRWGAARPRSMPTSSATSWTCGPTSPTSWTTRSKGDQFQQTDRRTVYGLIPSYTWAEQAGQRGDDQHRRPAAPLRRHRQGRTVQDPRRAQIYDTTREDTVGELAAGLYVAECGAVEQLVPLPARSALGLLQLRREQQRSGELRDGSMPDLVSPKLEPDLRPVGEDRVLRQRGLRLPQQRCARHHAARGSERSALPSSIRWTRWCGPRAASWACAPRSSPTCRALSRCGCWSRTPRSCSSATPGPASRAGRAGGRASSGSTTGGRCPWLLVNAELALTKARFTDDDPVGDYIPGALGSMATVGLTVDNYRNWFGTVQVNYFGARPLDRGQQRAIQYDHDHQRARWATGSTRTSACSSTFSICSTPSRATSSTSTSPSCRASTPRRRSAFTSTRRSRASSASRSSPHSDPRTRRARRLTTSRSPDQ